MSHHLFKRFHPSSTILLEYASFFIGLHAGFMLAGVPCVVSSL